MTRSIIRPRHSLSVCGFSLIEVLIALIIMSVGMLGIAGLYVQGMQAGRTSVFRHNAVTLAGDVADRIRANPSALAGAAYAAGVGADKNCVDGGENCSPANMAQHDIGLWEQQATRSLPNGTVQINLDDSVSPPTYEIVVTWDEPGETPSFTISIPVLDI
ncbi:MAG: type IV pilus modification protein PilV [Gammaproteobacteria bacterium]|nr:type IV pilus modification protein PilV [Gammaproteobacteria bacterium]